MENLGTEFVSRKEFSLTGSELRWIYDKKRTMPCPVCREKMYRVFIWETLLDCLLFAGWGPCACRMPAPQNA